MGIKRIVDTSFWTDGKVEEFSPEDKYFMLYLLTNPFSTQLGIYEISMKQTAFHLGYSIEAVQALIDRFENEYKIIVFSKETNEIAILNFLRYSIMKGGKPVEDCIRKEMSKVKNKALLTKVFGHIANKNNLNFTVQKIIEDFINNNIKNKNKNENDNDNENDNENDDSSHDSSTYRPTNRQRIVPRIVNVSSPDSPKETDFQKIVDLFNTTCPSFPPVRFLSEASKSEIKARLNTYTIDDFKQCFENAESSSFLKGDNRRNWTATFDWLIKDSNMANVLNGNYNDTNRKGANNGSIEKPNDNITDKVGTWL